MDVATVGQDYTAECCLCVDTVFSTPEGFANHLRSSHCSQEGGSFVCLYGDNQVCSSLPVEGISDADYKQHIYKHHVFIKHKYERHKGISSGISSFSDAMVDSDKWNVYSASQNLAAVLNNPNKIKQKDFFTKLWGEEFVEINHISDPHFLPTITKLHFDHYLKKLLKRYRRRSKLKKSSLDGQDTSEIRQNFPSLKSKSIDRIAFDVPDVFLKTKFSLSCFETFNFVFPHVTECIKSAGECLSVSPHLSSPSNRPKLLQEKLGHYLDMVEVQIARQVASKSDAFFHTMTSHDALMENLGQTISKVHLLRCKIQNIDDSLIKDSLKILKGIRSRNNYYVILKKLKIMATVYQTQPTVKLLLSTPDYVAALDLIYTTKDLLNNELAGIQCFRHLSSELNEVIKMIDALMTGELERYATADLNRPLLESEIHTLEQDKLLCIILGMLRRQSFSFVDSYWKETYATIKATIKQTVIEIVAESDSPVLCSNSDHTADTFTLDEQLKLLTIEEWVTLLRNTANALKILLERIKSAHNVMMKAVCICSSNFNDSLQKPLKGNYTLETEYVLDEESLNIIINKLNNLLSSACQYVCERYAHLLSKRSLTDDVEQNIRKQTSKSVSANNSWLAEQATLTQLNDVSSYVNELCSMCQKLDSADFSFMTLKVAFKTEANKFMKKFHDDRLKKLDMILENETWKQTPVPVEFQSLIDEIFDTGNHIHRSIVSCKNEVREKVEIFEDKSTNNASFQRTELIEMRTLGMVLRTFCTSSPKNLLLSGMSIVRLNYLPSIISESSIIPTRTVLLLINMIAEYCVRAEDITLSAQCLLRYLADLLQQFNRKSCKLVLGGEAVSERTGLKKITSSNLALLMRALQLLLQLMPLIRTHFTNLLTVDSLQPISCLERVTNDLQAHVKDISNKLLSIPSQIISTEMKNWEAKPPVPSKSFQNLSRNLKKLHEVVSCILTQNDVHDLYRRINQTFKNALRERIAKMNIINNGGPQHGIVITELIFYLQDLKRIDALPEKELNESAMNDIWD